MGEVEGKAGDKPDAASQRPLVRPFDLTALLSRADPFLRAVIDSLGEGVVVQGADMNVLAGNPAAESILGLSVGEMLERGPDAAHWKLCHPDGSPIPLEEMPSLVAFRSARPVRNQLVGMERSDGRLVWLRLNAVPLRAPGGEAPFAVVTTFADETARRDADQALRESERRLRLALSAARMNVWEWDASSNNARWTLGEFPGHEAAKTLGTMEEIFAMAHPEDRERLREEVRAILRGAVPSDPFELQMRVLRPDGESFWGRATGRAERNAAGRVVRVTGTLADVTHRHDLEAELHLARRMESIGRLAGGIAHDFNNLLSVMLAGIDVARESSAAGTPVHEALAAASESAERARQLTRQLLAFARRQPVLLTELDLNELLRDLARLLKQLLGPCELSLSLEPSLWRISADPTQLERVVLNLAANARDAMPQGGLFSITTQNVLIGESAGRTMLPGRYVALCARDLGVGMSRAVRERLFEPFFTTKADGNGLGLASSYGLVRQLGGDIEVESAPGNGATFRVLLPAAGATP